MTTKYATNPSKANRDRDDLLRFMRLVFDKYLPQAHVTGFPGDPTDPNMPRSVWTGAWWSEGGEAMLREDINNFYAVSTFAKDTNGRMVRTEDTCERLHALAIDDVGDGGSAKISPATVEQTFRDHINGFPAPSAKVETSPGNQQWVYAFSEPFAPKSLAVLVESKWRELVNSMNGGKDPGSANITRYLRPPYGINGKPAYAGFTVRLAEIDEDRKYHPRRFALKVLGITPEDYDAAAAGQDVAGTGTTSKATYTNPADDPSGWAQALHSRGLIGNAHKPGTWEMECPFIEEHTAKANTGAAYLGGGRFRCHHGHCLERTNDAFQNKLEELHPGIRGDAARAILPPLSAEDQQYMDAWASALWASRGASLTSEALLDRYVWLALDDTWFDLFERKPLTKSAFNALFTRMRERLAQELAGWTKGIMPFPSESMFHSPDLKVAVAMRYAPGQKRLYIDPGTPTDEQGNTRWVVNSWVPGPYGRGALPFNSAKQVRAVGLIKALAAQLTGDTGDQPGGFDRKLLNWSALVVACPGLKPNWQWLISSSPGFGKDTFAEILGRLCGAANWKSATPGDVASAYTDWAAKRFIIINELSSLVANSWGRKAGAAMFDDLKSKFASPPETININPKYGKQYETVNVGAYMLFSNHVLPLMIDPGERRLCVLNRINEPDLIGGPNKLGWVPYHVELLNDPEALEGLALYFKERWDSLGADERAELLGHAPGTQAKADLLDASVSDLDDVLEELEDAQGTRSVLWTNDDIRKFVENAGISIGRRKLAHVLKSRGWWRPYEYADPTAGRVRGVGGSGRTTVWACRENGPVTKDAQLSEAEIKALYEAEHPYATRVLSADDIDTAADVLGENDDKPTVN